MDEPAVEIKFRPRKQRTLGKFVKEERRGKKTPTEKRGPARKQPPTRPLSFISPSDTIEYLFAQPRSPGSPRFLYLPASNKPRGQSATYEVRPLILHGSILSYPRYWPDAIGDCWFASNLGVNFTVELAVETTVCLFRDY